MAKNKKVDKKTDKELEDLAGLEMNEIKKLLGKSLTTASDIKARPSVGTGSLSLDLALNNPLVEGTIVEFAGAEGTGKTTIALSACAQAQKKGYKIFYFDLERRIERPIIGCIKDLDYTSFHRIRPRDGTVCMDDILNILKEIQHPFIVVDSVPAILPEAVASRDMGQETMGKVAKLLSEFFQKAMPFVDSSNGVLLFLNQLRDNLNPYGANDVTPGGRALKFYSSQRVFMKTTKADYILDSGKNHIGHNVQCVIKKNSCGLPNTEAKVPIVYGDGVSLILDIFDVACSLNIIEIPSAGWYVYDKTKYRKAELISRMETDNDIANEITSKVRNMLDDETNEETNDIPEPDGDNDIGEEEE